MLSVFVILAPFNFLMRLHPSLDWAKKIKTISKDCIGWALYSSKPWIQLPTLITRKWRKSTSRYSLFPTVIENLLFWNSWNIKICQVQSTFLQQSSIILLFFKSRFKLFFLFHHQPDIKICKAGKVILELDKFCSLIIVKSCGCCVAEKCTREKQQCVNGLLFYDLKVVKRWWWRLVKLSAIFKCEKEL